MASQAIKIRPSHSKRLHVAFCSIEQAQRRYQNNEKGVVMRQGKSA